MQDAVGLAVFAQMATNAQPMCFPGLDHPAGDGQVAQRPLADTPHDEGSDLRGDEPDLGLGNAEARALMQDHDVGAARPCRSRRPPPSPSTIEMLACGSSFSPSGRRRSGDRPRPADRRRRSAASAACRPWLRYRRRRRNVRRRRGSPAARQRLSCAQSGEGVLELQHHGVREGVAPLRPVQHQPHHRAVALELDVGVVGHGRLVALSSRAKRGTLLHLKRSLASLGMTAGAGSANIHR